MIDAKLENRRKDASAKCANCAHWARRDLPLARFGICEVSDDADMITTDLTVCTGWELHEVHTGRILNPDEIIEE